jgi:predicted dithiol-disulfide oxidoreductase (DUF899 family)
MDKLSDIHNKHFAGESPEYRDARNKLLEEEIKLRRQTEEVAELRRKLPLGGKVKEDYVFEEEDSNGNIKQTKLSELFKPGKDTLMIYSFMYNPKDEKPCSMCNSIMDSVNGMVFHVNDRINFVAVAKAQTEKIRKWSEGRDWNHLRILSSNKNSYNIDYFGEDEKGNQMPMLNVFQRTDDGIFHFYATELMLSPTDPGQDSRHVDFLTPIWSIYDMTPEGRPEKWRPKFSYE